MAEWDDIDAGEFADIAIQTLRDVLDVGQQSIAQEHALHDILMEFNYVIMHLVERIPEDMSDLRDPLSEVSLKITEIVDLIDSGKLHKLQLVQEEEALKQKLEEDIKHRDWKAVRQDIDIVTKEEKEMLKLDIDDLKELHSHFMEIMKIIKRSEHIPLREEDLIRHPEKKEYAELEHYYFLQLYKFARAYEKIFRDLVKKERALLKKLS